MSIEAMKQALEALQDNRRPHYYCEDTWYSCPKHEDGCANEAEADECNCGADKANEQIDLAITALRQAIEQAEKIENPPIRIQNHAHTDHPMRHWDRTCPACVAEAEKEAVAWVAYGFGKEKHNLDYEQEDVDALEVGTPLYTSPPRKEWVELTDDDRIEIAESMEGGIYGFLKVWGWLNYAKALEAKLKEKNT